jgi:hypothetical protein
MRTAGALVPALSHDLAVMHEDTPHDGVGRCGAASALREFAGATQVRVDDGSMLFAEEARHERHPSSIRTMTVGPGISPGRPPD